MNLQKRSQSQKCRKCCPRDSRKIWRTESKQRTFYHLAQIQHIVLISQSVSGKIILRQGLDQPNFLLPVVRTCTWKCLATCHEKVQGDASLSTMGAFIQSQASCSTYFSAKEKTNRFHLCQIII